jgi:glycerophosphoryl diester phosphodiesterase
MTDVVFIAHRGASGKGHSPENTIAAFREAINIGVDCVECDVHCTKDGQVVVMHDSTLNRTTNKKGAIAEMTLEEVKQTDAGSWFSSLFTGERVPTLGELLELTKGKVINVIEIKPNDITKRVIEEIEKANAVNEVILQSFYPEAIKAAFEINPKIPRALLLGGQLPVMRISSIMDLIYQTAQVGASTLNLPYKTITQNLIKESHKRGMNVWAWTVDDESDMKSLINMGIDGITSNYPERLIPLRS